MQKNFLYTVLDVLEAITNNIDLMTGISTEFSDVGLAYQFLEARIGQVKDNIIQLLFTDVYQRNDYTENRQKLKGKKDKFGN